MAWVIAYPSGSALQKILLFLFGALVKQLIHDSSVTVSLYNTSNYYLENWSIIYI